MPEFKTVRGMRDFLPHDARLMRYIEEKARKVAQLYGFDEIITPIVESYDLLSAKAGEEVRSRMFLFKDLGGRDIALRPEFTASVARLAASSLKNEAKPIRLFSVGTIYRYDEPQKGRYREFWQSNYELIGPSRPEADAEIIMLTDSLMDKVGLKDYSFKLGHVGVLRGIFKQEKIAEKTQNTAMQLMDKKQYDDALRVLQDADISTKAMTALRALLNLKGTDVLELVEKIKDLSRSYSEALDAANNFARILKLITDVGLKGRLVLDAGFARGLEYYTGVIFEICIPSLDIALGGGGRYDKLVELFGGESTAAVGVAHGLDRIMLGLQIEKTRLNETCERRVAIIPIQENLILDCLKLAQTLRKYNVRVEVEVMGRKMTKALEDANRRNVDFAVIMGERELKEASVVVKDLKRREQQVVKKEEIPSFIQGRNLRKDAPIND